MGHNPGLATRAIFSIAIVIAAFGILPASGAEIPRSVFIEKFGYAS